MDSLRQKFLAKIQAHLHDDALDDISRRKYIPYGTAGFRDHHNVIKHIFYKVGLYAGMLCWKTRAHIGVMVTASHNPIEDNGVKIITMNGDMLDANEEKFAERFCNQSDDAQNLLDDMLSLGGISGDAINERNINGVQVPTVLIGYDTRPSSEELYELIKKGVEVWSSASVEVMCYGLLTTPALHFLVAESNKRKQLLPLEIYLDQLRDGIIEYMTNNENAPKTNYKSNELVVDCANGVGYKTMNYLLSSAMFTKYLDMNLIEDGSGQLNLNCGADFVKSKHKAPHSANDPSKRYASLDGDADRLVYFYLLKDSSQIRLLDGDKILALYAFYLKDILKRAKLEKDLTLGAVQTAYANGASTEYLTTQLGLKVDCVDTGVKNLHQRAKEYDIGVYFEANGHGTIWISNNARERIYESTEESAVELKRMLKILNNYTGDATSDLLLVEMILHHYDMSIYQWDAFYEDRPNCLTKVQVSDRSLVKTVNAGRTCLEPVGLQAEIDKLIERYMAGARCFVRASGTENVVRIYSEGRDQQIADELAELVGQRLIEMCNK